MKEKKNFILQLRAGVVERSDYLVRRTVFFFDRLPVFDRLPRRLWESRREYCMYVSDVPCSCTPDPHLLRSRKTCMWTADNEWIGGATIRGKEGWEISWTL